MSKKKNFCLFQLISTGQLLDGSNHFLDISSDMRTIRVQNQATGADKGVDTHQSGCEKADSIVIKSFEIIPGWSRDILTIGVGLQQSWIRSAR